MFARRPARDQGVEPSVSLKAKIYPRKLVDSGELITYTLEITRKGGANVVYPLPDFGDFQVEGIEGPNNAVYFASINGVSSTTVIDSYIYTLKAPEKGGRYTIAPMQVEFGGEIIRSNSFEIEVEEGFVRPYNLFDGFPTATTRPTQTDVESLLLDRLFIVPEISAEKCYVGEPVHVSWSLYQADSLDEELRILSYNFTCVPNLHEISKSFSMQIFHDWDTHKNDARTEKVGDEPYRAVLLRELTLFPHEQGELELPPFSVAFQLPDRSGPPAFFMANSRSFKVIVEAPKRTLEVLPWPEPGDMTPEIAERFRKTQEGAKAASP